MDKYLLFGLIGPLLLSLPFRVNLICFAVLFPFNRFGINVIGLNFTWSELFLLILIIQGILRLSRGRVNENSHYGNKIEISYRLFILLFLFGNILVIISHPQSGNIIELLQRLTYVLGAFFVGHICFREGQPDLVIKCFLFGAMAFSILRIMFQLFGNVRDLETHKNSSGLIFAMAFACAYVIASKRKAFYPLSIWFAISTMLTLSRSSIIAVTLIFIIFTVSVKNVSRGKRLFIALVIVLPTALFLTRANLEYLRFWNRDSYGRFDYPIEVRRRLNAEAINLFQANPWSGYGYGGQNGISFTSTHNIISQTAVEGGIFLLVPTMFLLVFITFKLWISKKVTTANHLAFYIWLATMIHALADSYWTRGRIALPWLIVGIAFANLKTRKLTSKKHDD